MPSNKRTGASRVRISYIEDNDVARKLEQIALETRLTLSDLVREATWSFIRSKGDSDSPVERDPNRPKPKKRRRA